VGDPVQPGAQRELAIAGPQPPVGAHEHLLHGVLGVDRGARQHLPRIGEHPLAIAIVDDPERVLVAGSEQRDELLVGADPEQRATDRNPCPRQSTCRCWDGGSFH
jgi:hypothetical protein